MNNKIFSIPMWFWVILGVVYYLHHTKSTERFVDMIIAKKSQPKVKIYNFNTAWCGWSKRFQPEWDEFSDTIKNNKNVTARDIKCDDPSNKSMCNDYNVPGFPSVIAEVDGNRIQFSGPRTADNLMEFVNKLT